MSEDVTDAEIVAAVRLALPNVVYVGVTSWRIDAGPKCEWCAWISFDRADWGRRWKIVARGYSREELLAAARDIQPGLVALLPD
jgi:hypothetical protein